MSSEHLSSIVDRAMAHQSLSGAAVIGPIDAGTLAELRRCFDSQSLFEGLLVVFLCELAPRLEAIRNAVERADRTEIAAAAHVLKGSSLLVGARVLAEICLQIELACKSDALGAVEVILNPLADEVEKVRQALTVALQNGGAVLRAL